MSSSYSPDNSQPNISQTPPNNEEEENNAEERIPLPPRIPLNYKMISKKSERLPILDSEALFQSNNINNDDAERKSIHSLDKRASSNLFLFKNDSNIFNGNDSIEQFTSVQMASKQPDFSPANINIEDYFIDLFRREINTPNITTKEEFKSAVEPYSIENYAKHHFRKRLLFISSKESIRQLTTFSGKPLSKPLLEKVPLSKKAIVELLSYQILLFIGVIKEKKSDDKDRQSAEEKRDNLLPKIVCMLRDDESLIDEAIVLLIRLTRDPPGEEKLILTWKLLLVVLALFYVPDQKVANVIRWFLLTKVFNEDHEANYARFALIRFHERNVLARNFDSMSKTEIINVPLGVSYGKRMFKTSLYFQLWNQKRKFPRLPIPLTPFLIVRALVKNGVFMTPKPFPFFEGKYSGKTNMDEKNAENRQANNESSAQNNENEIVNIEINENEDESNYISSGNSSEQDQENEESKKNKENEENKEANDSSKNGGGDFGSENQNKEKFKNKRRKANVKLLKLWSAKLSSDYELINDGEVCDLFGLLMIWMLNLLDPIVPKSMIQLFFETFNNEPESADSNEKYKGFVDQIPLLHLNTLKYLIGFLREVAQNEKFTLETHRTIADDFSSYFVNTSFATVDPFTRQKVTDVAPRFLFYCLENLDVSDVYPLNPLYEERIDDS